MGHTGEAWSAVVLPGSLGDWDPKRTHDAHWQFFCRQMGFLESEKLQRCPGVLLLQDWSNMQMGWSADLAVRTCDEVVIRERTRIQWI